MRIRINDEQRDISYGELVALQQEFEVQLDENGVIFDDDESYEQALGDFIQQYIDGDDNPMIDLSTANVRPVRDSKRRRVKDSDDSSIKAAIDEVLADYFPDLTVDDYHIYGDNGDGLLAQAEVDGCDMYVFKSDKHANAYILDGYGVDYVSGAMSDDEWVDYLINGGVEPEAAEDLIERHDWQGVVEVILDTAGAEWFLASYSGEVFYVGGYAIYF